MAVLYFYNDSHTKSKHIKFKKVRVMWKIDFKMAACQCYENFRFQDKTWRETRVYLSFRQLVFHLNDFCGSWKMKYTPSASTWWAVEELGAHKGVTTALWTLDTILFYVWHTIPTSTLSALPKLHQTPASNVAIWTDKKLKTWKLQMCCTGCTGSPWLASFSWL